MALSKLLLAAGATVLVAAIGWWWTTFGDVVAYGYLSWTEAGRCLVHDSDICALAKMLCLAAIPDLWWPIGQARSGSDWASSP